MNKYDFTELVKNPGNLGENEVEKLKALTRQYPYFSVAQNLLVKSLHRSKHYEYDKYLKQAALQAGSRAVLYNLVHDLPLDTEQAETSPAEVESLAIQMRSEAPVVSIETPALDAVPEKTEEVQKPEEILIPEPATETSTEILLPTPAIEDKIVVPEVQANTEKKEKTPAHIPPAVSVRPEKDPDKIYEEEKLVNATGHYIKFVPKPLANEEEDDEERSLIADEEDLDMLEEFDISSLGEAPSISRTPNVLPAVEDSKTAEPITFAPAPEPVTEQEPEPEISSETSPVENTEAEDHQPIIAEEPLSLAPEYYEEPLVHPASIAAPDLSRLLDEDVREPAPNAEPVPEADPAFLSWLAEREEAEHADMAPAAEETTIVPAATAPAEPVSTHHEDHTFVNEFHEKLAGDAHLQLNETIQQHLQPAEVAAPGPIHSEHTGNNSETAFNPLQSLENYEVNEYLAPLYTQVKYNLNLFENAFNDAFGGSSSPQPVWTMPFVTLEEKPKTDKAALQPALSEKTEAAPEPVKKEIPKKPVYDVEKVYSKEAPEVKPKLTEQPKPRINRDQTSVESILDKFIRENPSIARPKSEFYSPVNMARQSAEEDDELVSETLAQIYTRQGLYKKAISMYEKLGLQYPGKLPYFAGLISQLKSEHNIE